MGWQWSLAFMDAVPTHANQRKMLRRGIGPQRIGSHNHIFEKVAAKLMLELHNLKGDFPSPLVLKWASFNTYGTGADLFIQRYGPARDRSNIWYENN